MKYKLSGRPALIVLCIVLGLILTVLAGGTIYANHLMGLMNRVEKGQEATLSQEELDKLLQEDMLEPGESVGPELNEDEIDWGDGGIIQTSDNIVNILLIGQDAREGEIRARSDSMILLTFNKTKKTITMTSFLRDLYLKIPGYQDNRINVAYPLGGMELLDKVIAQNFGVRVDGNVEVDFSHFADVIDVLGGVDIELRDDEAKYINSSLDAAGISSNLTGGMQHLNGDQALRYSRIRYLDADGDFSRTNRQRKVINSLIEKFRNTKMTTLLGMLDELLPMLTTDMTNAEILGHAKNLLPMLPGCTVVSQRVPQDGKFNYGMIRGMSVVVADMKAARQLMVETLAE